MAVPEMLYSTVTLLPGLPLAMTTKRAGVVLPSRIEVLLHDSAYSETNGASLSSKAIEAVDALRLTS